MNKVLFSRKSDNWATPDEIYFYYIDNGYYGCFIFFVTGRLHFNNNNSAPFPSCYVHLLGTGKTICEWRNRIDGE